MKCAVDFHLRYLVVVFILLGKIFVIFLNHLFFFIELSVLSLVCQNKPGNVT